MSVHTTSVRIRTRGFNDVHDLTSHAERFVGASGLMDGLLGVFVPGSTAAVTTIEFESGALEDLKRAVDRLAPRDIHYDHDARWGDGNGFAHVRAALLGPSLTVPVTDGRLQLGTWQQIILIDFDNRPREREVLLKAIGD